jgi:hypothetical protein
MHGQKPHANRTGAFRRGRMPNNPASAVAAVACIKSRLVILMTSS